MRLTKRNPRSSQALGQLGPGEAAGALRGADSHGEAVGALRGAEIHPLGERATAHPALPAQEEAQASPALPESGAWREAHTEPRLFIQFPVPFPQTTVPPYPLPLLSY